MSLCSNVQNHQQCDSDIPVCSFGPARTNLGVCTCFLNICGHLSLVAYNVVNVCDAIPGGVLAYFKTKTLFCCTKYN